jgi:hypothetical protein
VYQESSQLESVGETDGVGEKVSEDTTTAINVETLLSLPGGFQIWDTFLNCQSIGLSRESASGLKGFYCILQDIITNKVDHLQLTMTGISSPPHSHQTYIPYVIQVIPTLQMLSLLFCKYSWKMPLLLSQ